jgi:hypothetical protein
MADAVIGVEAFGPVIGMEAPGAVIGAAVPGAGFGLRGPNSALIILCCSKYVASVAETLDVDGALAIAAGRASKRSHCASTHFAGSPETPSPGLAPRPNRLSAILEADTIPLLRVGYAPEMSRNYVTVAVHRIVRALRRCSARKRDRRLCNCGLCCTAIFIRLESWEKT